MCKNGIEILKNKENIYNLFFFKCNDKSICLLYIYYSIEKNYLI